jgi:hypothetical protein
VNRRHLLRFRLPGLSTLFPAGEECRLEPGSFLLLVSALLNCSLSFPFSVLNLFSPFVLTGYVLTFTGEWQPNEEHHKDFDVMFFVSLPLSDEMLICVTQYDGNRKQ